MKNTIERLEKLKASVRARVEHPFRVVKQQFGYTRNCLKVSTGRSEFRPLVIVMDHSKLSSCVRIKPVSRRWTIRF